MKREKARIYRYIDQDDERELGFAWRNFVYAK